MQTPPDTRVIVGSGVGGQSKVRVFDGTTATPLPPPLGSFTALTQNPAGEVRVAGCDFNSDGTDDIIASPGLGKRAEVRVFDGVTGLPFPAPLGSFLAFETGFLGGVHVACGDLTGDSIPDIIAARGGLAPPEVRVFDGVTATALLPQSPFGSFLAFNPGFQGGVRVAACDLNQDGTTDIIAGRGPGAQPEVRAFDGVSGDPFPLPLGSFPAFGASFKGGVYVACSPNEPPVDTAPAVTSTTPSNGATGVTTDSDLTITFSEEVNVAGNWFQVNCPISGVRNVAETVVSGLPNGPVFTIDPVTDFAPGEACTTTVFQAQVTDEDGTPDNMAADFTFGFTTDAAPTVTSTDPSNGATGVPVDSNITVNFSESVATTAATFGLECAGTVVPFAVVVSPAPPGNAQSYTLNPSADLPAGTCTVKVTAATVTDVDTNDPPDTMVADFTSTFTSGANDPPAPSGGPFSIPENSANGTPVGTVAANDPDTGQPHTFAITGGNTGSAFAIDSTGAITVNSSAALDFETTPSFSLTVEATDDGSPPLSASTTVTINVTDVNENQAPVPSGGPFSLPENSLNGTSVGTVAANDPDAGQTHTFAIIGGNTGGAFTINGGGQITVANTAALNFETTPSFSLTVQVTDNGSPPSSGTASVTVSLTNVNEAPIATAKTHQTHSGIRVTIGAGHTGKLKDGATDPDADDTFATLGVSNIANITPAGAAVTLTDPATGTFTYNPPAGLSGNASASFTFDVCDNGVPDGPSLCDTETVTFNITGPDLWFVDDSAAAGGTGQARPIPSMRSPISPEAAAAVIGSSSSPASTARDTRSTRANTSSAKDHRAPSTACSA